MKKTLAILLTLVLAFSMAFTAFAESDANPYTITINNSTDGHTYEAYQIFTGTLSTDDKGTETTEDDTLVLADLAWGTGVDSAAEGFPYATVDAAVTAVTADSKAFIEAITPYLSAKVIAKEAGDTYTISGLAAGYYLVKDADTTMAGKNDAYTAYILEIVEDSTVTPKTSSPTVEKKVDDVNDTTGTTTGWQDSADYDIGDTVPFQLTATLGSDISAYESYRLVFHDTMSAGLAYKELVSITLNGTDIADGKYKVVDTVNDDGTTTLTVTVYDLIALGASAGQKVVVTYNATLDTDAIIGSTGNPNEVYLEYTNNPNQGADADGDGVVDSTEDDETPENIETGKTTTDKVIVFTYMTQINKTDGTNALEGAAFLLEKKVNGNWITVNEVVDDDATTFKYEGIDDGLYRFKETDAPEGYNKITGYTYFTVEATHDVEATDPAFGALTAYYCDENGAKLEDGDIETNAATGATANTANFSMEVINKAGSTLPETGGIGTTIFYVVGGLLMLAAVVIFVAKRKVGAED